jgi:hypothetical protein
VPVFVFSFSFPSSFLRLLTSPSITPESAFAPLSLLELHLTRLSAKSARKSILGCGVGCCLTNRSERVPTSELAERLDFELQKGQKGSISILILGGAAVHRSDKQLCFSIRALAPGGSAEPSLQANFESPVPLHRVVR